MLNTASIPTAGEEGMGTLVSADALGAIIGAFITAYMFAVFMGMFYHLLMHEPRAEIYFSAVIKEYTKKGKSTRVLNVIDWIYNSEFMLFFNLFVPVVSWIFLEISWSIFYWHYKSRMIGVSW